MRSRNQERIEREEAELEAMADTQDVTETTEETTPKEEPELSGEERSFKKRYGDLRRHSQEKERELLKRIEDLEAKLNAGPMKPPKTEAEVEAWVKKYPDVAAVVQTLAEKVAAEKVKGTEDRLKELDELRQDSVRKQAEDRVRSAHPDFDQINDSDDFHDWVETQPKWVKTAAYEDDDADSLISVLDLYKAKKGLGKKPKDSSKEAAMAVQTKSSTSVDAKGEKGVFTESQVQAMSDKEYEKNEAKILASIQNGTFIYDLSG